MTTPTNKIQELYQKNPEPKAFATAYFEHLKQVISSVNPAQVAAFIDELWKVRDRGGCVYFLGNGGSHATASHFVNDITIGTRAWHKPFRAMCLSDNVAGLTAIGNDYGYDDIFVLPLKAHLRKGDVVVAISASGNSPNVIKAMEYAKSFGAVTIGLTGFDGGKLMKLVDHPVHVPTTKGEYGPVEDVHMIFDHLVHAFLAQKAALEK